MKKQLLVLAIFLLSIMSFAQKAEMKMVKKAIAGSHFSEALTTIKSLEGMSLDDKTKAKFLYFKAQALQGAGKITEAAKAITALNIFEAKIGKSKYTKLVKPMLAALVQTLSNKGIKEYEDKNYALSKVTLEESYNLRKQDTAFLEYAANASYLDKDYTNALRQFTSLKDMGYTGISTQYTAKNKSTGKLESFNTEGEMKNMVKLGLNENPTTKVTESKAASIIKNIAYIYVEKGDTKKAKAAFAQARTSDPKDVSLIISEANLELKLGNKARFGELMKEAIALEPNNANLYYNVGVINQEAGKIEEAKVAYRKAIELDPNNVNSYINLGAALLEKDKVIVEELNANLDDFDKYDAIKVKQLDLYKEVLPTYEKAYSIDGTNKDVMRNLMTMYENLDMMDKLKEVKAVYDGL